MITDTHAHIYSPDKVTYPPMDAPVLVPPERTGSPEGLKAEMDACGVGRVLMVQTTTYYSWDNSFVRDTVPRSAPWAQGVYTLDPEHIHSAEVLLYFAEQKGLRAVRTYPVGNPTSGRYDHPGNRRLWDAAREAGAVVNVLIQRHEFATDLSTMLGQYPDVNVTLDHCIALDVSRDFAATVDVVVELARFPNLNAKISFLPTGSAEEYPFRDMHDAAHRIIRAFGPDRCVWGSDYPTELWCPKTDYAGHLNLIQSELGLTRGEQQAILEDTPERLYFGTRR
ncbi:MAG: amidohydrolase family protein [Chloroflexi bacterium]|nr:amidohydrolase family protein [Chloroflexota bacterium]